MQFPEDKTSNSRPDQCYAKHANIYWKVDFEEKVFDGFVTWDIVVQDTSSQLRLDTRDIEVKSVVNPASGEELNFNLENVGFEPFGRCLVIDLPTTVSAGETCKVKISYRTSPKCSALQWLNPEQTAGKSHPYLFSQCQAIHARSLMPCQDTPSVKITYDAVVCVPEGLTAVMGALGGKSAKGSDGNTEFHFAQKVPIATYLTAVAVGALESRKVGPRTNVWCEKEMIDQAAYEFAETETMLKTAESIMGPYVWGQYDLLILPPSFPFGGMENPCLTFVTPTVLAGDRSLTNVIAHEIAHSWTGNLATNATFEHFWLNEGHTTYLEYSIGAHMNDNSETYRQFLAVNSWKALVDAVNQFKPDHPFTKLVVKLENVDPDEAFSTIPYIKGFTLLFYLEQKVGGRAVMEKFVRAMVEEFSYSTFTTEDWKALFLDHFSELASNGTFNDVDWNAWFHSPGMPPFTPKYDQTMVNACTELTDRWVSLATEQEAAEKMNSNDLGPLLSMQIAEFLGQLVTKDALPCWKIAKMQELYELNEVNNSEIRIQWMRLCIRAHYEPAIDLAINFATSQGRMKFTRPIYRDLSGWDVSRSRAIDAFQKNRPFMHNTTAGLVAKDLKLE